MLISEKLYCYRKINGLSQNNMTKDVISAAALSRIERKINTIFADDLIEILKRNHISIMEFLKEYSTADILAHQYQQQARYYFENKELDKLIGLDNSVALNSRLLSLLIKEMIRSLKGEKLEKSSKIKKLLFKLKDYDERVLWYLTISLKLYPDEDFSVIVETVFKTFLQKNIDKNAQKELANISVEVLKNSSKNYSVPLKNTAIDILFSLPSDGNVFLQKLAGRYLLAKQKKSQKNMIRITYQVALADLQEEFLQLVE